MECECEETIHEALRRIEWIVGDPYVRFLEIKEDCDLIMKLKRTLAKF